MSEAPIGRILTAITNLDGETVIVEAGRCPDYGMEEGWCVVAISPADIKQPAKGRMAVTDAEAHALFEALGRLLGRTYGPAPDEAKEAA